MKKKIRITVNGRLETATVDVSLTLVDFLRDVLGLLGTKKSCGLGNCGACTVILEGEPVNSCLVLAVEADGRPVQTIEGLGRDGDHPLQQAFVEHGAIQCGFCTPGMILTAKALLDKNPDPTEEEVKEALAGNLCRCTGYVKILEAVLSVTPTGQGRKRRGVI